MAASHYVALIFGVLFMLAGLVKLLPLDPGQQGHGHPEMNKQFQQFITVLPLRDALGIKTPAMYISLVGVAELTLGTLLAFGRPGARVAAAVPLLGIMIGAFYTLRIMGEPLPLCIPSVVFGSAMVYVLLNRRSLGSTAYVKSKSS
ncbi:transmembrane protein 35B-like [Diadema setosum]|uniref:transmembrane protein 35B-like n=1 Tax=Diadema setosum TaxID=31175 RepID=UPI003B3AAFA3